MKINCKLSIIIPIYNVELYLRQCLNSVVNQTLRDIEIICVNDGSTDKSAEILDEYVRKDFRIKTIYQTNQGQACARNNGMKVAKGEYIGFVDSDDWISLDFYEKLYTNAKKENAEVSVGSVIQYCEFEKKQRDYYLTKQYDVAKDEDRKKMISDGLCWNKIYERSMIETNQVDFPAHKKYEDSPFIFMVVCLAKKIVFVKPETFYFYRKRENSTMSLTAKKQDRSLFDFFDVFEYIWVLLEKAKISRESRKQIETFAQEESIRRLNYWLTKVPVEYKEEFFQKLKKIVISYDIQNNSVVGEIYYIHARMLQSNNVNEYLGIEKNYCVTLFKQYPITVFRIKSSSMKKKTYLFSILPIWKEKIKAEVRTYYLLAFIPVFKKKLKSIHKWN